MSAEAVMEKNITIKYKIQTEMKIPPLFTQPRVIMLLFVFCETQKKTFYGDHVCV